MDGLSHVESITVVANGQERVVRVGSTLGDLLQEYKIVTAYVVVQLDGEIVPRSEMGQVILRDGNRLEIVTLAGGG